MNQLQTKQFNRVKWGAATVALAGALGVVLWFASQPNSKDSSPSATAAAETPHAAQPVRVTEALRQSIRAWVFAEGTARSVQREYLTFDRAGRVTYVKPGADGGDLRAGESVAKGTVLARLDPRQYESEIDSAEASVAEAQAQYEVAQSDITQAQTEFELATATYRRAEQLLGKRAISQAEYEQAEASLKNAKARQVGTQVKLQALKAGLAAAEARLRQAKLTLDEIEIVSPIDGIIAYLNIEEGFYFTQSNIRTTSESDALLTIPIVVIDPSRYEITVDVPAYQAGHLAVGQQVLIVPGGMSATAAFEADSVPAPGSSDSTIQWQSQGTVFSINPAVNPGGRSVQLKIRTSGGSEHLKDGMFVACWIEVQNKPEAIVAPFEAFLFEENQPYVFVIDPSEENDSTHGLARRVPVQLGIESLATREILSGVRAGELLATEGRYRLVDSAPVRIVKREGLAGP